MPLERCRGKQKKTGRIKMNLEIHGQASKNSKENFDFQISEKRLWTAVLLQALEDWKSCNMRRRSEAEKFFFESESDFETVCRGAGLNPSSVISKLQKMRTAVQQQPWFAPISQAA
jgi:hypothetical protein